MPLATADGPREPAGVPKILHLGPDFDTPDPGLEAMFTGA